MIDKWFINDVREKIEAHHRLVITDTKGEGAFLLDFLPKRRYIILTAGTHKDELSARIEAERDYKDKNVIFYTTIPQHKLTQLQEYAVTCGCIVLDDIESYIKKLLYKVLGVNSHIDGKTLILAAKMSKGMDENWWKGIAQGITNPMKPEMMILDFLKDPAGYAEHTDKDVFAIMQKEACRMAGKPETKQTPSVLAAEIMKSLFDGLLNGQPNDELLAIYYLMSDSEEMADCLQTYIDNYQVPALVNPLDSHPDHPFTEIDKKMFRQLSSVLRQKDDTEEYVGYIEKRLQSSKAKRYKSAWLKDTFDLLTFQLGNPHTITDIDGLALYYRDTFAAIDTAIRRIYVEWLNEEEVLRPIQEFYEERNRALLDSWFQLIGNYQSNQQGLIKNLFNENTDKVAIIVCDGLRLEIAEAIARKKFSQGITIDRSTAWAKLPSVTVNGMSALYGVASPKQDSPEHRRTALLADIPDAVVMKLSALNNGVTADHLVLKHGDIDTIGEHKQLAGLVDIAAYEEDLYQKVQQLLRMGYTHVILTADHGFVITGILDEADKVPVPSGVVAEERFATAPDHVGGTDFIERCDDWITGAYQYYAMTDKPFRTRGQYGYAHGGLTLQECLIPVYRFSKAYTEITMGVEITNKTELSSVTGQFYTIKLKGKGNSENVFESERKVKLHFYDENGAEVSQSMIIKVKAGKTNELENTINTSLLKVVVVDAQTTEQLDSCTIKKSASRDLDDLF